MNKTIALFVSMAILFGTAAFGVAQTTTTTPAPAQPPAATAPAAPAPTPSAPSKGKMTPEEKHQKAMASMEQKKTACLQKAGNEAAKQAECQKKFEAAKAKMEAQEQKAMQKQQATTPKK